MTFAPRCLAIWIAALPTPLLPPCTNSHSPALRLPSVNKPNHAVRKYGGNCRCLGRGDSVGDGPDFGSFRNSVFRVTTETRISNDTLADSIFVNAGAELFNYAGKFATRNERECIARKYGKYLCVDQGLPGSETPLRL